MLVQTVVNVNVYHPCSAPHSKMAGVRGQPPPFCSALPAPELSQLEIFALEHALRLVIFN